MGQQNTKPITIEKSKWTQIKQEQVLSQKVNFPFENIQKAVDFLEHKKYIVENGFLGMGGSAIVMKACSEDNDYLAIKFLVNPSQSQIKACQQEFEILSQYQTPHIIKVYDMIQEEHESINYQILIMERCAYDLKSFLERNKSNKKVILNAQINNICLELAKGLRELHSRNILHLDIKPANILYGIDLMWKYADLGISKSLQNKDHTEHLEGFTAQYSSPEQYQLANCNFRTSITKSSDIYSLGLVFMELTGVDLMKKWVFKQQLKEGNFEKYLNPNFEQINKIIMQMVCYDSEERLEIDNVVLKIKQLIKNEYESNQNKSKVQVLKRVQSNNILLQKEEFRDNSPINQNRKNSNLDVDQNTALYCNKKIQPNQLKKQKQQENLVQNCLKMILLNGRQISREIIFHIHHNLLNCLKVVGIHQNFHKQSNNHLFSIVILIKILLQSKQFKTNSDTIQDWVFLMSWLKIQVIPILKNIIVIIPQVLKILPTVDKFLNNFKAAPDQKHRLSFLTLIKVLKQFYSKNY